MVTGGEVDGRPIPSKAQQPAEAVWDGRMTRQDDPCTPIPAALPNAAMLRRRLNTRCAKIESTTIALL